MSDFEAAVRAYHAAAWRVLDNPAVWQEETQREGASLPYPIPLPRTQYQRLLRVLVSADIDVMLVLFKVADDPRSPAWGPHAPDVNEPKMQVLLRVACRSMQAGSAAIIERYGGRRVTGRRDYVNAVNEQSAAEARRVARVAGITFDRAYELMGLPRRQALRSAKRIRDRPRQK